MWARPQSQTTYVHISDGCLHLSHLEWLTNLSLDGYPLKWQCPISKPVNILSWFLLRLNNSPVVCTGFLNKAFSTCTIWILLCSGSFMRNWLTSQNNLEFIWKLSRALMTAGKNIDVPTCVALSFILHYTGLNGIFSLDCCGVEPKTEAAPT